MTDKEFSALAEMRKKLTVDGIAPITALGILILWVTAVTLVAGKAVGFLHEIDSLPYAILAFGTAGFFLLILVRRERECLDTPGRSSVNSSKNDEEADVKTPPLAVLEGVHPILRSHYTINLSGTFYPWSYLLSVPVLLLILVGFVALWEGYMGTSAIFNPIFWASLGLGFLVAIMISDRIRASTWSFLRTRRLRIVGVVLIVMAPILLFGYVEAIPYVHHVTDTTVRIVPYVEQNVRIPMVQSSLEFLAVHLQLLWRSEIIIDGFHMFPDDRVSNYSTNDNNRIWGPLLLQRGMGTRAFLNGETVVYVTFLTGIGWNPEEKEHKSGTAACGTNVAIYTSGFRDPIRLFETLLHEFGHIAGIFDHNEQSPIMSRTHKSEYFVQTIVEYREPFNETLEEQMRLLRNGTLESYYGASKVYADRFNRSGVGTNETTIRLSMHNDTIYFNTQNHQFYEIRYSFISECDRIGLDCSSEERMQVTPYCPNVFLTAGTGTDGCYAWAPSELEYFGYR